MSTATPEFEGFDLFHDDDGYWASRPGKPNILLGPHDSLLAVKDAVLEHLDAEDNRPKPRRLTRMERLQAAADAGYDTPDDLYGRK